MRRRLSTTVGLALSCGTPALADACTDALARVHGALAVPQVTRTVRAQVASLLDLAQRQRNQGDANGRTIMMAEAKRLLRLK